MSQVNRTGIVRPLIGGISVGHWEITAGTLGMFVKDTSNNIYIMSNNHVLAAINKGKPGDPVLQPGPYDLHVNLSKYSVNEVEYLYKPYVVGHLSAYVPLKFQCWFAKRYNEVDVAIAKVDPDVAWKNELLGIGSITGVNDPVLNLAVKKSGRTTGVTMGRIIDTDATIEVWYEDKVALFDHVIVIQPALNTSFTEPGDSGSIVVNENNEAVAEIFAGGSGYGIAFPVKKALQALGVTLA